MIARAPARPGERSAPRPSWLPGNLRFGAARGPAVGERYLPGLLGPGLPSARCGVVYLQPWLDGAEVPSFRWCVLTGEGGRRPLAPLRH